MRSTLRAVPANWTCPLFSARKAALDRFLLRVVDGGLAGTIFVAPLLMGGRHALGQLALTVLAVAVAWAWAARQCLRDDATWRSTWATPLVLIGLVLVVLQTVPLPPWLLARLSPESAATLPLWNADGKTAGLFGYWPCISFAPAETLAGLVIFLDLVLLFFVAVQRIQRIEDVERLLRWCALSAVAMASFGIVQLLAGNGKFFWFYEHPFSDASHVAKGSFSNRNHFAQFLALGIGPLIWWLQDAMRRRRGRAGRGGSANTSAYLVALALGVVLFAGLLSLSRGGTVAMFVAAAICTVVCYRTASLGGRFVAALTGAGALIGLSLAIFGYDQVSERLGTFTSGSIESLDSKSGGRRTIWATTLKAAPHHLLLGSGVGSYPEVYLVHADAPPIPEVSLARADAPLIDDTEPSHAEDGYLQVLLETGAVGLGLVLAGMVLCASWCVGGIRSSVPTRLRVCAAAIAGSLGASAVHAVVDFVWYVPACMAIVAILAACALRVRQMAKEGGLQRAKPEIRSPKCEIRIPKSPGLALATPRSLRWSVAVAVITCAGTWMIANRIGPAVAQTYWDDYLVELHAAEAQDSNGAASVLADAKTQQRWIACLENVVRWQPTHAQAHLKLVETHRRLFDILQSESPNPMSVLQLSDAVFREPRFRSRAALMEWLPRAVGPHWTHLQQCLDHAWKALRLCPLEGRAYVSIAELSFLWTSDRAAEQACIDQATRVRPFDGEVLYAAGNQALLAGNAAEWRADLKRAFRCGRRQQQHIMADCVAAAPPECLTRVVADILHDFQPDRQGAAFLQKLCEKRCSPEELAPLVQYRADAAETDAAALSRDAQAADVWLEAYGLHRQLHHDADAFRCAGNALQCDSGNYDAHYGLGLSLLGQSQFAEAETHWRWCLQRTPGDRTVEANLREALKGRLDQQRRAAKENGESLTR